MNRFLHDEVSMGKRNRVNVAVEMTQDKERAVETRLEGPDKIETKFSNSLDKDKNNSNFKQSLH